MALAHIRSGEIIKRYSGDRGWVQLEDGRWLSQPVEGFADGNDKIVPIVQQTNDTSTGTDVVRTRTEAVEADRVLILTEIRDMTAQEVSDRNTADADGAEQFAFVSDRSTVALMMTLRDALKAVRDGQLDGLTDAQITSQIRTRFRANYEAQQ